MTHPKITDDDRDTITATLDGREIRSWHYSTNQEQCAKMLMAQGFAEGWCQAMQPKSGTKPAIPWDAIHSEFKWAARDEDGQIWVYVMRPKDDVAWNRWAISSGGCDFLPDNLSIDPGTCDWRDSLVQRPEATDKEGGEV